jgi:hypothetical protein
VTDGDRIVHCGRERNGRAIQFSQMGAALD